MKLCLLPLLLLTSCSVYDSSLLPFCFWSDVGPVYEVPGVDPKPGNDCFRLRAPDGARVSAVPLDTCDASDEGLSEVTVPIGEPVFRYSSLDLSPGKYQASWVPCPEAWP